jgi:ATP-dependent Clp protease adaptor protein ClpS
MKFIYSHHFNASLTETEIEEDILIDEDLGDLGLDSQLIVYNDDHNTFDWVIRCFIDVLKHSSQQSEQLAILIHYKGQATVKTAPFAVLRPLRDALVERGLSAVIERQDD